MYMQTSAYMYVIELSAETLKMAIVQMPNNNRFVRLSLDITNLVRASSHENY